MVFQQHTLFPWRRVRDNVAFGLKMQGLARAERNQRAMEMLGLVGLADFAGRWPGQLSGVCSSAWRSPGCWSTGRACC